MTSDDHNQIMSKVGIADLKAHLSHHLRKVRHGHTLTVLDRDTPVAQIIPYDREAPLEIRRATRKARDRPLPLPPEGRTDSLAVLLEDRAAR
jgi:prevent-host-death family protein